MDVPDTPLDCRRVEEEDLVSLYVREALPEEKAEQFEKHYFECDACWDLVQTATELKALGAQDRASAFLRSAARAGSVQPIRRPFVVSPALKIAAAVLVALGAGAVFWWQSHRSPDARALVNAAGGVVPFPVRLSGDFSALQPVAMRGPASSPARLRREADRWVVRDEEMPTAATAHGAGIARLLTGDSRAAVDSLKRADQTPAAISDLAAAYLARGIETASQDDLHEAIDQARRAVQAGAGPEALFNLAEALDHWDGAAPSSRRDAWNAYLAADSKPPWADIARRRLAELGSAPAPAPAPEKRKAELRDDVLRSGSESSANQFLDSRVAADPQLAREYFEEEFLVEALRSSPGDFDARFGAAERFAAALRRVTANALPEETVASIRSAATGKGSAARLDSLAEAHEAYTRGQALYRRRDMRGAMREYEAAERELRRLASPFAGLATVGRFGCLINQNRLDEAYETAARLRAEEEAAGTSATHSFVVARCDWAMGLVRLFQGYSAEAISSFQSSVAAFDRLGERENIAAVSSRLAECYDGAGDHRTAWRIRERTLGGLDALGSSTWRARIFGDSAAAASAENRHHLARYFLDLQVDSTPSSNEPMLVDALASRAVTEERTGEPERSLQDLSRAALLVPRIEDSAVRDRSKAQLALTRARLDGTRSVPARLQDLEEAIRFFEAAGNHLWIAEAFEERGKLHLAQGDTTLAEQDWRSGIGELEEVRQRAGSEDLRISRFGTGRTLFEDLIALLMKRGRAPEAFDLTEQARSRALLDRMAIAARSESRPLRSEDLRARLAPETVLVSYFVLPDRLCIWVLSAAGLVTREAELPREEIRRLVELHRRRMQDPTSDNDRASAALYAAVIWRIEPQLEHAQAVVFVPDDELSLISFAALGPTRGRRVVDRWTTQVAPSASYYVGRVQAADNPAIASRKKTTLIVAASGGTLDAVGHEAAAVGAAWPSSVLLEGQELTKARFLELAPRQGVIHFAGHGVGGEPGGSSALLLGPQELLFANEIQRLDLTGVGLVYLSACSTASGALRPGEGPNSVARAFLSSGASAVVATLWPVDDEVAAALASRFYRFIRSGDAPAVALRRAQLELLAGTKSPIRGAMSWAAFQLTGAATASKGG
jgi:CHAT domain-containing protein